MPETWDRPIDKKCCRRTLVSTVRSRARNFISMSKKDATGLKHPECQRYHGSPFVFFSNKTFEMEMLFMTTAFKHFPCRIWNLDWSSY